jgi:hypothetical protein
MEFTSTYGKVEITELPNECPFCHKSITPIILDSFSKNECYLEVFMRCPNLQCEATFIAYYRSGSCNNYFSYFDGTSIGKPREKAFSKVIETVSSEFINIYNEAFFSDKICGVGYRKALEFLIKDYAIINHPAEKEIIERKLLGACINEYVSDHRIKVVAKRAAWLGNDETHYFRKWEQKNLNDLKKLIDLSVHWIEMG